MRDVAECPYRWDARRGWFCMAGCNSSVKTRARDTVGGERDVFCVEESGANMAVVEPADLPALDFDRLRRLRSLDRLAEVDIHSAQRACLLDGSSRDPSLETLLHTFLLHKFIAHRYCRRQETARARYPRHGLQGDRSGR